MNNQPIVVIESFEGKTIEQAANMIKTSTMTIEEAEKKVENLIKEDSRLVLDNEGKIQLQPLQIKKKIRDEIQENDLRERMTSYLISHHQLNQREIPPPAYDNDTNQADFRDELLDALRSSISNIKHRAKLIDSIINRLDNINLNESFHEAIEKAIDSTNVPESNKIDAKKALNDLTSRTIKYSELAEEPILPPKYGNPKSEKEQEYIDKLTSNINRKDPLRKPVVVKNRAIMTYDLKKIDKQSNIKNPKKNKSTRL